MFLTELLTTGSVDTTAATEAANITFNPGNFVANLQYMGIGMLVIFIVIGMIALTTVLINKVFSE